MINIIETKDLGSFYNVSQKMIVSDPCYSIGTWCQAQIENVMPGEWRCSAAFSDEGDWGIRVAEITALNERYNGELFDMADVEIGVDSGQAGIYDAKFFGDKSVFSEKSKIAQQWGQEDDWYEHNCDVTLSPEEAGVIPFGFVSSSGFGDGSYILELAANDAGWIVGIRVIFIDDEDEEDDEVEIAETEKMKITHITL